MKMIKWSDKYLLGIDIIDDQHKELFSILAKIQNAVRDKKEIKELETLFEELIEFTHEHFLLEEKYFRDIEYIHTEEHCLEHQYFIKKLIEFMPKVLGQESNQQALLDLFTFIDSWKEDHILNHDAKYVSLFKKQGI